MIAFVRGTVTQVGADRVVIDVGPMGLSVLCTPATALSLRHGEQVELTTTMVVREDGWTLYGFLDADEREVFEQVQTVSGIGPRIALALLGTLMPDDLRRAVAVGDEARVMSVPGIGRKGAQRLILELKDRLGPPTGTPRTGGTAAAPVSAGWQSDVGAALVSLGWSAREADAAVAAIDPEFVSSATAGSTADVGGLLKAALRTLDRS